MSTHVDLSVVIPAYDEERRLPSTLDTVLAYLDAQPGSSELVVVDDGSADGTAGLVAARRDPRLQLIRWPVNRGKGHAVRVGVLGKETPTSARTSAPGSRSPPSPPWTVPAAYPASVSSSARSALPAIPTAPPPGRPTQCAEGCYQSSPC